MHFLTLSSRIYKWVGIIICGTMLITPVAHADQEASDINKIVTAAVSKQKLPSKIDIFVREIAGWKVDDARRWGYGTYLCDSSTDPQHGACETSAKYSGGEAESEIVLTFTERKTKNSVNLKLIAYRQPYGRGKAARCTGGYFTHEHYAINDKFSPNCGGYLRQGSGLSVYISADQLALLPSGGIWEADLKINVMQGEPFQKAAEWRVNIQLNIDDNAAQLYFPAFHTATPRMALNLRDTGKNMAGAGHSYLDMCMYDGYGANSQSLQLTLSDGVMLPDRSSTDFTIIKQGALNTDKSQRIDFQAFVEWNGMTRQFTNQSALVIPRNDYGDYRLVMLPGINVPVACTLGRLRLSTPAFDHATKAAGQYSGTLRLEFKVETGIP